MNRRCSGPNWPNLTPSRAADLVCRKKYHELHVLKNGPGEDFSPTLVYGSASHDLLKRLYDPMTGQPTNKDVSLLSEVVFGRLQYPDPDDREADRLRCVEMVQAYLAQDTDAETTKGVEIYGKMPLLNGDGSVALTLGAKFDRLLVRPAMPHCLVIRDYKTGRPGPLDMEGACLMLAIARVGNKNYETVAVEFDWIGRGGLVERAVVTVAEVRPYWPSLKSKAFSVYGAADFPAQPGEHCMFCPLRTECQPDTQATVEEIDAMFA